MSEIQVIRLIISAFVFAAYAAWTVLKIHESSMLEGVRALMLSKPKSKLPPPFWTTVLSGMIHAGLAYWLLGFWLHE